MAEIQLRDSETGPEYMPDVCMACGRSAKARVRKTFSWSPPWIVVTVLIAVPLAVILMLVLTKRMTVYVPLCKRHRGYWWKRQLLMWLPLLGFAAVAIAGGVTASQLPAGQNNIPGLICVASAGIGFIWLIIAAVIQTLMIRPKEITDRLIVLKGVHEDFVEAFHENRRKHRNEFDRSYDDGVEDYDERLRRRRQRRERKRTGHDDESPPDNPNAFRIKPDD